MNREFTAESWTNIIPRKLWYEAVQEAEDMIDKDVQVDIQGYDIDPDVVAAARENAKRAGVEHMIHFQQRAVADLHHPKKYGFIISNLHTVSDSRRNQRSRHFIHRLEKLIRGLMHGRCI